MQGDAFLAVSMINFSN